jgi:hypothetical protein
MKRLTLTLLLALLAGPALAVDPMDIRHPYGASVYAGAVARGYREMTKAQREKYDADQKAYPFKIDGRDAGYDFYKRLGHLAKRMSPRTLKSRAVKACRERLSKEQREEYGELWVACFLHGWKCAADPAVLINPAPWP